MVVEQFIYFFWETARALVGIFVPILALFLVFRLVHDLLWG